MESIEDYFKRVSGGTPKPESIEEYSKRTGAPFLNPGAVAAGAAQNVIESGNRVGTPAYREDVIGAAKQAQEAAIAHNNQLLSQSYSRQEDIKKEEQLSEFRKKIEGGYDPNAPNPLSKDDQEKLTGLQIGWKALDHYKDAYQNALGTDPAFGNVSNYAMERLHPEKWSQARQNFEQVRDMTTNAIAAGTLRYTPGAEGKANVMEFMQGILPDGGGTPQMVDSSVINLKQKALDTAIAHRQTLGNRPGLDTTPLDNFIADGSRELGLLQENYKLKYNPNPQNPGSSFSPQLQQMIQQRSGKPPENPVSSFSPGTPGMPNLNSAQPSPLPSPQ